MKRIGFVINGRLPEWKAMKRGMKPHHLLLGWPDYSSPMHFMRHGWVADAVNRDPEIGLRYELFKPWRRYDAVVFLKSMEAGCAEHAERLKERGVKVIFEANVDYYTEGGADGLAAHLKPTPSQREMAIMMTTLADSVIASSRNLAGICSKWNQRVSWVPDHIPERMIPVSGCHPNNGFVLPVWWSGMADKISDLLATGEALRSIGKGIHLHLVTGDLSQAMSSLDESMVDGIKSVLSSVPHTVYRFKSVRHLLDLYASVGGVIISPRFLDSPYNRSHTEWKITLGMACGLPAIASPQPSYLDVRDRSADQTAVTICTSPGEWAAAFETARRNEWRNRASEAACSVVREHYVTEVVAPRHAEAVRNVLTS